MERACFINQYQPVREFAFTFVPEVCPFGATDRKQEVRSDDVSSCTPECRMKDLETQQRFVELRAQGWSFVRIAKELNVAKGTLITWSRKLRFEIQNHRAVELEGLRERLIANRETRAQLLSEQLRKIEAELHTRNLSTVSTTRLYSLAAALRHEILAETDAGVFSSPTREIPAEEYHEEVQNWQP